MKLTLKPDMGAAMALAINLVPIAIAVLAFTSSLMPAIATTDSNVAPDALVKTTVDEVLDVIKRNKDRRTLRQLAEQKILPKFDFREMTKLAVGPAWQNASQAQQQSLESGFRSLLVNTYTTALSTGVKGDQKVDVTPTKTQANQNEVVVKTVVKQSGRMPIPIDYRMKHAPDGWKVFDVLVEGMSLVTTYRETFSEEVKRSGIDGLIKALDSKNQRSAAS